MSENTETTQETKERKPWPFRPRWRIRGCLVTETPLFIGSGDTSKRDDFVVDGKPVEIADCLRDHRSLPVIPATSLRGVLSAWIESAIGKDSEQYQRLLGKDSIYNDSGRGGEAEFLDAPLSLRRSENTPLPHWDGSKQTWIEIINSIDRERGAAAVNHLAHAETVAPGTGFDLILTGQFSQPEEDISLLLAALEAFNDTEDSVNLGADTISGKGRMRWELAGVEKIAEKAVLAWLEQEDRGHAETAFRPVTGTELEALLKQAQEHHPESPEAHRFDITLRFDGPFLVNDPLTAAKVKREKQLPQEQRTPDAKPRTDAMGRVILPVKSLRGVLRSHGERILRTLLDLDQDAWRDTDLTGKIEKHIACRPEIPERACKPLRDGEKPEDELCLACQLFGAPGWRSPVVIDDFTLAEGDYEIQIQEMLAVDRFTGGGKDSAKYNARAIISPVFEGNLKLGKNRVPAWGLGLLALVLRDLMDGELRFGWGAAGKGYGRCQATIENWNAFKDEGETSWQELLTKLTELENKINGANAESGSGNPATPAGRGEGAA